MPNENENKAEEIRTYEIVTKDGLFQIDIPESYKVTYGMLHPGMKGGFGGGGHVLRIYESDTKQRAVFQDVLSFRDLGLPLRKKKIGVNRNQPAIKKGQLDRDLFFEDVWENV